ncbi:MAG: hypothetical protein A2Z14_17660 [Chloroflexi bacterium RBG_16_48_8]|nr:MAG: hypothetical protein A2Z14_17660 [Chloroflexi bacterium RBG_16_48_8]
MVELMVVKTSQFAPPSRPIGVIQSLMAGFDKIAAKPYLLVPPILLDLFLWLGPRLTIASIFQELMNLMGIPYGADEAMLGQIEMLRSISSNLGQRLNLFAMISNLPAGISSLMTSRMPVLTPLDRSMEIPVDGMMGAFFLLVVLMLLGQTIGTQFHLWIAQQVAPGEELAKRWTAIGKMILLAVVLYIVLIIFGFGVAFIASLSAIVLPLFGLLVAFFGFTFGFWIFVYLFFTPHGIVRYGMGIFRAMMESATLVRWNLLPAVGYLGASFGISWLTNQAWLLPTEDSWYLLLAIVGHAFVSAALLAGSYAFYQGRREWFYSLKHAQIAPVERGGEG